MSKSASERMLITEQRIKELKDKKMTEKRAKVIKRNAILKNVAIGSLVGFLPTLTGKVKPKYAIAMSALFSALGAAYAIHVDKDYIDDGTIKDQKDEIIKFAEENLQAAKQSANALFSTHADDFLQEHSLYDAEYDYQENKDANTATQSFINEKDAKLDEIDDEMTACLNEQKELKKKEEAILKENPEAVVDQDVLLDTDLDAPPAYGPAGDLTNIEKRRREVSKRSAELKEQFKAVNAELKMAIKQSEKETAIITDSLEKIKKYENGMRVTLCNRVARDHYYKAFVEPMEKILKEAKTFSTEVSSYSEEIAYEERLDEFLKLIAIVGKDHESIGIQYNKMMEEKIKKSGGHRGLTDMTYADAPYYKIFEIAVNPNQISQEALNDYIMDIKKGAYEDVFIFDRQKGRWLQEKNLSRSWMYTIGDFTEEEATKLEYLLDGYIDCPIDYKCDVEVVNKAYRAYCKDHHEDVGYNDGSFQETSKLMKKLRQYLKNRDESIGRTGEADGTSG